MKNLFYLIVGLGFILGSVYIFLESPATTHPAPILVGDTSILVEVLDTETERALGLSGRSRLEEGRGMLFVFELAGTYGFWMKDMKFPIDIVWISEDMRVVGIEKWVTPESYPRIFYPTSTIKYVLEVPAGYADEKQIVVGERVGL